MQSVKIGLLVLVVGGLGCGARTCNRYVFDRLEFQKNGKIPGGGVHNTMVPVVVCREWAEADGGVTYVR